MKILNGIAALISGATSSLITIYYSLIFISWAFHIGDGMTHDLFVSMLITFILMVPAQIFCGVLQCAFYQKNQVPSYMLIAGIVNITVQWVPFIGCIFSVLSFRKS